MKNLKRIIAAFLVVLMVVCLGACSDLPKSSSAQWSYRSDVSEYAIGVHIYSVFSAYSRAYTEISTAQGENFDEEASILDIESTFDETSGLMRCGDWIEEEADRITRSIIGLDLMIDQYDIKLDEQQVNSAREQARADWYLGPYYEEYVSYGSASTPYRELLEPFGVSFDSFFESVYLASVKQNAVFDKFYNKGGIKEVPEKDINDYFEANYTSYGCFTVNFYDSTYNPETATTVNTPFDSKKTEEIKTNLENYLNMMNEGHSFESVGALYAAYADLEYNPIYQNIEIVSDGISDNLPDEVVAVLSTMAEGDTRIIYVGKEESRMAYVIHKNAIKDYTQKYVKDNYSSLLQILKDEEFFGELKSFYAALECEINTEATEEFSPELVEKYVTKITKSQ